MQYPAEYTVHFQRGTRVGARSLRMVHVTANSAHEAEKLARREFPDARAQGYRLIRTDVYDPESGRQIRGV